MKKDMLSENEWKQLCNHFLSELAKSATRGHGSVQRAANAIGVRKQRISGMRSDNAVGDKVSWIRMLFYKVGLSDKEAQRFLSNPNVVIKSIDAHPVTDEMYESLKNLYSENELSGWFKILLNKRKIETDFKISLKALDRDLAKKSIHDKKNKKAKNKKVKKK